MCNNSTCCRQIFNTDNIVYVANLGDSRAVLSMNRGKLTHAVTIDHKPENNVEKNRILQNGGKIYQNKVPSMHSNQLVGVGPLRIFPGGLSVARTIGDVASKLKQFDGIPNIISCVPDIHKIILKKEHDFLFLGCDGIFDRLSNEDISNIFWTIRDFDQSIPGYEVCQKAVDKIIEESLFRQSYDNVTGVLLMFDGNTQMFGLASARSKQARSRNSNHIKMNTNYLELPKFKKRPHKVNSTHSSSSKKARDINIHTIVSKSGIHDALMKNLSSAIKMMISKKQLLKSMESS